MKEIVAIEMVQLCPLASRLEVHFDPGEECLLPLSDIHRLFLSQMQYKLLKLNVKPINIAFYKDFGAFGKTYFNTYLKTLKAAAVS